jgi:long-chain acyl-CoA synthetase
MQVKNLGDMLRKSCAQWGDKPAILYSDKGFKAISYSELLLTVQRYAGVVKGLGLKRGDRITVQSENCKEWVFLDWACRTLGVILVPIYPTLPADQSQYIIKDCGSVLAIAGSEEQAVKSRGLAGVDTMFLREAVGSIEDLANKNVAPIDTATWNHEIDAADPEDVATIIYTSGTTGLPKGAMLPHRSFTFLVAAIRESLPITEADTFLSFLPMAHVYERFVGLTLVFGVGATVAFARSLKSLASDMVEVKPTIMACVPRFLEATRDRIIDTAAKDSPLKQKLFQMALRQGTLRAHGEFAPLAWILDALVGKKIRDRTGGRMRFFVSGGAALPPHVSDFYQAFGLLVIQGYGLTETTAVTSVNQPYRNRPGTVGPLIPGVEASIAADGEILVRGPARMIGYYNLPKETAEALDADGWFHTGDIGEFDGDCLKITDRKKDLLILANGKNVAPQSIENKLRESAFISEAVLFGDGNEFVYGLILPNWERVRAELKMSGSSAELAKDEAVRKLIKGEVDKVNKTVADFEKVKKHAILDADFSVESGELTPSLKVKRRVVKEKYASLLAELAG